jgi:hypothetical protein
MNDQGTGITSVAIPKDYVDLLIDQLGLVRNVLSPPLRKPPATDPLSENAAAWWQKQPGEERALIRLVLEAVASPALVVDAVINLQDSEFLPFRAIVSGMRDSDPAYLVGDTPDKSSYVISVAKDRQLLVDAVLLQLDFGSPLESKKAYFTLPPKDLAVFCLLADLSKRLYFTSLLEHSPLSREMELPIIEQAIRDSGNKKDIRWLFPTVMDLQNIPATTITGSGLTASLDSLENAGLVQNVDNKDAWRFTPEGSAIASSFSRQTRMIVMRCFGTNEHAEPAVQTAIFLQSPPLLWYLEPGLTESVQGAVACVSLGQAEALLSDLFQPVTLPTGIPPEAGKSHKKTRPSPTPSERPVADELGAELAVLPPSPPASTGDVSPTVCPSCHAALPPGHRFCGQCGTEVDGPMSSS